MTKGPFPFTLPEYVVALRKGDRKIIAAFPLGERGVYDSHRKAREAAQAEGEGNTTAYAHIADFTWIIHPETEREV